jgi:hypothetical protein
MLLGGPLMGRKREACQRCLRLAADLIHLPRHHDLVAGSLLAPQRTLEARLGHTLSSARRVYCPRDPPHPGGRFGQGPTPPGSMVAVAHISRPGEDHRAKSDLSSPGRPVSGTSTGLKVVGAHFMLPPEWSYKLRDRDRCTEETSYHRLEGFSWGGLRVGHSFRAIESHDRSPPCFRYPRSSTPRVGECGDRSTAQFARPPSVRMGTEAESRNSESSPALARWQYRLLRGAVWVVGHG